MQGAQEVSPGRDARLRPPERGCGGQAGRYNPTRAGLTFGKTTARSLAPLTTVPLGQDIF